MNPLKKAAKSVLEFGAATFGPHRWPSREPRLWVLMYHRVLPAHDHRTQEEEPGMVVTPETFKLHLQWLRNEFEIVQLGDWVIRNKKGLPLPKKACAITFDDGWKDNYEYAFPILKEMSAPASIFAVSDMIGTKATFWPNRVARLLSDPRIYHQRHDAATWLLKMQPAITSDKPSREVISRFISACKTKSDDYLLENLTQTEESIGISQPEESLMNWDELREMVDSGVVEIGSHTQNHVRLTEFLAQETAHREIISSKHRLEEMTDRKVHLFCYPNGDAPDSIRALVSQHYSAAVTTLRGMNTRSTDPHSLRRIGIHEDVSDHWAAFYSRLSARM